MAPSGIGDQTRPGADRTLRYILGAGLSALAVVLLVGAVMVWPSAWAGIRPGWSGALAGLLGISGVVWFLGSWLLRRSVVVSPLLWLLLMAFCLLAAAQLFAGATVVSDPFTTAHFERVSERWPVSVVSRGWSEVLVLSVGLAVCVVTVTDMASVRWARLVLISGLLLGGSLAVGIGLAHNFFNLGGPFGSDVVRPGYPFGPFFHHTVAGSFINLFLPLALALLCHGLVFPGKDWSSLYPIAVIAATIGLAGQFGHPSRLAPVLSGLIVLVALSFTLRGWSGTRAAWRKVALVFLVFVGITSGLVAVTHRFEQIEERWSMLWGGEAREPQPRAVEVPREAWPSLVRDDLFIESKGQPTFLGDRGRLYATALRAITAAPWLGHGPGGWRAAASLHSEDPFLRTFYLHLQFAHNDALQFAVEWGVMGLALVGATLCAALFVCGKKLFQRGGQWPIAYGVLASLTAILIQGLIDFPLQIPANQLFFAVLIGLAFARIPSTTAPSPAS